jgi:hypothetical protein
MTKFTQKNKLNMIELQYEGYTLKILLNNLILTSLKLDLSTISILKVELIGLIPHKLGRKVVGDLSNIEKEVLPLKEETGELKRI